MRSPRRCSQAKQVTQSLQWPPKGSTWKVKLKMALQMTAVHWKKQLCHRVWLTPTSCRVVFFITSLLHITHFPIFLLYLRMGNYFDWVCCLFSWCLTWISHKLVNSSQVIVLESHLSQASTHFFVGLLSTSNVKTGFFGVTWKHLVSNLSRWCDVKTVLSLSSCQLQILLQTDNGYTIHKVSCVSLQAWSSNSVSFSAFPKALLEVERSSQKKRILINSLQINSVLRI